MMRLMRGVLLGLLLAGLPSAAFAADPSLRECTKTFSVGTNTRSQISTKPAKLCSMSCISRVANGWGAAWDAQATTYESNGIAQVVGETGAATLGNSAALDPFPRYTNYGLMIETVNSYCTGTWVD